MKKIRVLIVEDHAVVREGLKILIGTEAQFEVAGEAEDGHTAIQLTKRLRPDVVLMDVAMPRCNGLDATRTLAREAPYSRVLVLSAYNDEEFAQKILGAGAAGYLTKHSAAEDLLTAIREVNRGNSFLSPRIAEKIRRRTQKSFLAHGRPESQRQLTGREQQVLRLIAAGLANKQISHELGLSIKTVEKHRQATMDKLDIHDRAGLTRYALDKGFLTQSTPPLLSEAPSNRTSLTPIQ